MKTATKRKTHRRVASLNRHGPCRHYNRVLSLQARGLCEKCYKTPAVRDLYPAQRSQLGRQYGEGLGVVAPTKPAAQECRARPGTPERMATYTRRLQNGEQLYHPLDAGIDLD